VTTTRDSTIHDGSNTDGNSRSRAALGALGICVGGFAAGVLGLFVPLDAALAALGLAGTVAGEQLSGHGIQIGFAAFGLAYLLSRDDRRRYLRLRRPTLRDFGWLVAATLAVPVLSATADAALTTAGLPADSHGEAFALYEHPTALPALVVGLFLFAAPAEELVYRGLIHGRLRGAFGTGERVFLAAALFGLMHLFVGLLTPGTGFAGILRWGLTACLPGLVWGLAYERTENLAVTAVSHALTWTIPLGTLLGL
jgi:membrane protease YdiL (CAAX protease family)